MFCSNKNCSPRKVLPFLAVSIAVFWLMWFGVGSLISKGDVEQGLKKLEVQLDEMAKEYGRNVKLTYGDIVMEGWGYNKKAVVNNLEIEVSIAMDPIKVVVSSEKVVISSDPLDFRRLVVRTANMVNITQDGESLAAIQFSDPLMITHKETMDAGSNTTYNNVYFPKKISLLKAAPTGGVLPEEQGIVINFAEIPVLNFVSTAQKANTLDYNFSGVTVINNEKNVLTIGNLNSKTSRSEVDPEGRIAENNDFNAKDVVLHFEGMATKPYMVSMNSNILIESKESQDAAPKSEDNIGIGQNREVTLNNLMIANSEFKMDMAGKFANIKEDPLPFGEVLVTIDNVSNFMNSEMIQMLNMGGIEKALEKVTGHPVSEQTVVSIPLKREKAGTFYIGKITFEEMMASMLSGSFFPDKLKGERMSDMPSMDAPGEPAENVSVPTPE